MHVQFVQVAMIEAPKVGVGRSGARDSIADVAGVTVGHVTLADGGVQTGVTVVRPHAGDAYRAPVPAAAVVINGFGKTAGLVQLNELGSLESPIALTNTFAVGSLYTAMVRHAIADNPAIGRGAPTLNPVVGECNDGWLNDLQRFAVQEAHYARAFDAAAADFAQGAVGAGRGMSCFGVKGGIGSASRTALAVGETVTLGALVLANFGRPAALTVRGVRLGRLLTRSTADGSGPDRGSIIVVLATDAQVDHRQLRRIAMRAAAGIARTGSSFGHGSGDIAIAFATPGGSKPTENARIPAPSGIPDDALDTLFDAAAEATEQSIVHALFAAQTVTGHAGHVSHALTERIPHWPALFADAAGFAG